AEPVIKPGAVLRTQGSCFANNIAEALKQHNVQVRHLLVPEAINSPRANRLLFEHIADPTKTYAHPVHERIFARTLIDELRNDISTEHLFILTLGVAATWFLAGTDVPVFQTRGLDQQVEWRRDDVVAVVDHIRFIMSVVRSFNPTIKVVLTVSPVP